MTWLRMSVSLAAVAVLACEGRKRTWRGFATCDCTMMDGGMAAISYLVVNTCAPDQPDCVASPAQCAQLLADAGCNVMHQTPCAFDPGWDYCDPFAPGVAPRAVPSAAGD
jgi:hypothetical protein